MGLEPGFADCVAPCCVHLSYFLWFIKHLQTGSQHSGNVVLSHPMKWDGKMRGVAVID